MSSSLFEYIIRAGRTPICRIFPRRICQRSMARVLSHTCELQYSEAGCYLEKLVDFLSAIEVRETLNQARVGCGGSRHRGNNYGLPQDSAPGARSRHRQIHGPVLCPLRIGRPRIQIHDRQHCGAAASCKRELTGRSTLQNRTNSAMRGASE
jgi:hypothetical protein